MSKIASHLDLEARTVTGRTLGEDLEGVICQDNEVIRDVDNPVIGSGDAGAALAVLRGNLCPDGAVIKPSAASAHLMRHTGRALMSRPRLLLLDEPSFGLAPLIVRDIFEIMKRINQEERVSILLVEQNAALALDVADSVYLLETGRIVLSGDPSEIRDNDAVRRGYLGE